MARWKTRVEFLLSVIELIFLSLTDEALQEKTCQNLLLSGGGRSIGAKISGVKGRPWGIFFGFYKTMLLSVGSARTPYSGSCNFWQYFYGIRYLGHPLTSTENFTEIVPGEPLRWGS